MNDPKELERMRYQSILDAQWEAKLIEKQYRREKAEEKSFHRGPEDDDWEYVK